MGKETDFITAEKRDLKELGGVVSLLLLASLFGTAHSNPLSIILAVVNLVGLFLFVPIFIGAIRVTKRGSPAIKVLGVFVLLLSFAALAWTIKWIFQLY
jgi:hypothetical protein